MMLDVEQQGISAKFDVYAKLGHGFSLGTETVPEGWIKDTVAFWEKPM